MRTSHIKNIFESDMQFWYYSWDENRPLDGT